MAMKFLVSIVEKTIFRHSWNPKFVTRVKKRKTIMTDHVTIMDRKKIL
jgi:hypothetical protein